MNYFHLIPLFAGIVNVLLGAFVVLVNPRRRTNQIFLALSLGLAVWNLGAFALFHVESASQALVLARITMAGVVILPALFYHFVVDVAEIQNAKRKVMAAYVVAAGFLAIDFTPFLIAGVRPLSFAWFSIAGPGFWLFTTAFFPVILFGIFATLVSVLKRGTSGSSRQLKLLLAVICLLWIGGTHDVLPVLGFDSYPGTELPIFPWGTLVASFYGLIIGYGVLSEQMLEIRVSVGEHSSTLLRLGFLLAIAYVLLVVTAIIWPEIFTPAGLFASWGIVGLSGTITALFLPKLLGGVTGRFAKRMRGDRFEFQDKIAYFLESTPAPENVQEYVATLTDLVFEGMKLTSVGMTVSTGASETPVQALRTASGAENRIAALAGESTLIAFFRATGRAQLVARAPASNDVQEETARSVLLAASLERAVAIAVRPKSPVGVLMIGARRNRRPLSNADADILERLCRSAAFAVERIGIIQAEQLRNANRAKDQFLANINHEIRNPLNGITGLVHMLSAQSLDGRQRFLLATLQACTDQLRSTMDEVLDFTRIEAERITLEDSEADLRELVVTTCASLDFSQSRVVVGQTPEAAIFVRCDAGKVRQVLSNFVANALKYGVPPGGRVDLEIKPVEPSIVRATITVTSTGPTLSTEEIGSLFTPLTRGRRARETNAHGLGLGLALSKKLADAMKAAVGVKSAHGETSFWFSGEFVEVRSSTPAATTKRIAVTGGRALAIEDERHNRLVLGHYLTQLGIVTEWADNGRAALAALQEGSFDVILMDWFLPDLGGAELLREMKRTRGDSLPPVIVVSAYSTTAKRSECLAAGANAFIAKPIDFHKLATALAGCEWVAPTPTPSERRLNIDLSSLLAVGERTEVLGSFLQDVEQAWTRLTHLCGEDPRTAALLAHRLQAQMKLVRATDAAGFLAMLEQAVSESWPTEDRQKLVASCGAEIELVLGAVRHASERSARA